MIAMSDIRKIYDMGQVQVRALSGIDLDVSAGDYVAIMGPSGSGKSTLMNLIGCLDTPSGGSYKLNSREVGRLEDDELTNIRNTEVGSSFRPSICCREPVPWRTSNCP